jgi:demethoxyubiquinone hydroxylase (CLK1/Coq7/Cat5 family)
MNVKYALTGLIVAVFSVPAFAQSTDTKSTPRIDQRQANQEKRIEQGAKSGELTTKETAKLEKGQAKVQKKEDKAVADGKVTKKEQKHIEHAQDQQSKKIEREKHDKQTAK